jgi:putative FmdB family regulatory protein
VPTYEYRCDTCTAAFVRRLKLSEYVAQPRRPCPACGSVDTHREIATAPGLRLGASGSNLTDQGSPQTGQQHPFHAPPSMYGRALLRNVGISGFDTPLFVGEGRHVHAVDCEFSSTRRVAEVHGTLTGSNVTVRD